MNMDQTLSNKTILLIITGGIAAYKSLELIRLLKKRGANIHTILTKAGAEFVTPLSISALSGTKTYQDLWNLNDEQEMGHIRLSRESDLILIAPATANIMAKMACGIADDLATTTLLASDKNIMIAPAMNPQMWKNQATQENLKTLESRGVLCLPPEEGEVACHETGKGRMCEPETILEHVENFFGIQAAQHSAHNENNRPPLPLAGKRALVTSGPTHEAIDPVRFISNHSSGKQGHAIASTLASLGADVTLISGPVSLPDPQGVNTVHVKTAKQMLEATLSALKSGSAAMDIAVCVAAVADWGVANVPDHKIKKDDAQTPPQITLTPNPDILQSVSQLTDGTRPQIVVGFAAETNDIQQNAQNKIAKKQCDFIIANIVDENASVFGSDMNTAALVTQDTYEPWPKLTKQGVAEKLAQCIIAQLNASTGTAQDQEKQGKSLPL